jgi:hypothetical protein
MLRFYDAESPAPIVRRHPFFCKAPMGTVLICFVSMVGENGAEPTKGVE